MFTLDTFTWGKLTFLSYCVTFSIVLRYIFYCELTFTSRKRVSCKHDISYFTTAKISFSSINCILRLFLWKRHGLPWWRQRDSFWHRVSILVFPVSSSALADSGNLPGAGGDFQLVSQSRRSGTRRALVLHNRPQCTMGVLWRSQVSNRTNTWWVSSLWRHATKYLPQIPQISHALRRR